MPANCWGEVKLALEELMADHHVVHHIVMMSTSLIMHRPSSIDKIQATLFNQTSDLIFHIISLTVPPHGEEFHLNLCKSLFWILDDLVHVVVNDHLDLSMLDILCRSCEVLIYGLEPAYVVV